MIKRLYQITRIPLRVTESRPQTVQGGKLLFLAHIHGYPVNPGASRHHTKGEFRGGTGTAASYPEPRSGRRSRVRMRACSRRHASIAA